MNVECLLLSYEETYTNLLFLQILLSHRNFESNIANRHPERARPSRGLYAGISMALVNDFRLSQPV